MKAKRLTALALAALMAASTTSVALAGERVDADLDFANDGYYKYNSDTNRLESAKRDEFQPGDDVYLRLEEDSRDTFTNKKTYNAYADWTIGDSWVKDIDIVYRKGEVEVTGSSTTKYTLQKLPEGLKALEGTEIVPNSGETPADAVKENVLRLLKEKYGMEESDFTSAELEIVPAGKARDCGLDRSMILSYGQDDRVCAFTSLFAMLDVKEADRTGCCLLVDKEEIGSVGATGMHSRFFENTVAELIALTEGESELKVRRALANSRMLSSDVSAAYDPMYAEVFEKRSSAFFANGLTFNKFTGSRGKSGSNDANAEYIAELRKTMDEADVAYQFAELGRVDAGGGGTIAYIMANYGMEVIDSGVAVLNMHAPYEVSSKADVYEAVKGYRAFLKM